VPVYNGFNHLYAAKVAWWGLAAYRKNPVFSGFFSCFFEMGTLVSGGYSITSKQDKICNEPILGGNPFI
jgi:hypothetical protein